MANAVVADHSLAPRVVPSMRRVMIALCPIRPRWHDSGGDKRETGLKPATPTLAIRACNGEIKRAHYRRLDPSCRYSDLLPIAFRLLPVRSRVPLSGIARIPVNVAVRRSRMRRLRNHDGQRDRDAPLTRHCGECWARRTFIRTA